MGRPRTGELLWRKSGWRARYWTTIDGEEVRVLKDLGTTNRAVARRRLAQLMADPAAAAQSTETVDSYVQDWLKQRTALEMPCARYERTYWEGYCRKEIGHLALVDVKPHHVQGILDDAAAGKILTSKGTKPKRATLVHLRGILFRIFKTARKQELIPSNPVELTEVPTMREMKKKRTVLTDAEFSQFIGCSEVDLELRMAALISRTMGGLRSGDVLALDWSMFDVDAFTAATLPRGKTGDTTEMMIPDSVRLPLKAWWERWGSKSSGPVFPVRRGERAGEQKSASNRFAKRLQVGLWKARVTRLPPVKDPADPKGQRMMPNPADPIYHETRTTLPCDFHTIGRRGLSTALARAGVNVQQAMALTHHASPKVHMRYVADELGRTVPDAALPQIPEMVEKPHAVKAESKPKRGGRSPKSPVGASGFEPPTPTVSIPAFGAKQGEFGSECTTDTPGRREGIHGDSDAVPERCASIAPDDAVVRALLDALRVATAAGNLDAVKAIAAALESALKPPAPSA